MPKATPPIHAVILAGGRGTRFWPRSRMRSPKQLLNIVGKRTMLQQTVERLLPLLRAERIWTVTNAEQASEVRRQLPGTARRRVVSEPLGRNTAAAIALAAIQVRHAEKGDALMAVLPADHFIAEPARYRKIVKAALQVAKEPGRMVVLGIPPTHPETGFGYVERMGEELSAGGCALFAVRRFTEKPALETATEYVRSGNYHWNAGMFFWRVSTFLEALKEHLPATWKIVEELAQHLGKASYSARLKAVYPKLENISVDHAILEPATRGDGRCARVRNSGGDWLERYWFVGRGPSVAGEARGGKCCGGRVPDIGRDGESAVEPGKTNRSGGHTRSNRGGHT